jgi:hypothetical protein
MPVTHEPDTSTSARPEGGWPEPTDDHPTEDELEVMVYDSVVDATDGCSVEPDGTCPHGHPSWLIHLGYI